MPNNNYTMQWQYSEKIKNLRILGELDAAISKCIEATRHFPQNDFFYKILGDLYIQTANYEKACYAYLQQLIRMNATHQQFNAFARSFKRLESLTPPELLSKFRSDIAELINNKTINPSVRDCLTVLFAYDAIVNPELSALLKKTDSDRNLSDVRTKIGDDAKSKELNRSFIQAALQYRINAIDRSGSHKTDQYFISLAERLEMYNEAVLLISKKDNFQTNPMDIRSLLRICRKMKDYSFAESLLPLDSTMISKSEFNAQYELVYYFEYRQDELLLKQTLHKMRMSAKGSVPIARTLHYFYLRFNMFEEARDISEHINKLKRNNESGQIDTQTETEQEIADKIQELVSEQEHNRQMIALRDLLKGFSHELGQPITNIRYAVQLHQMKLDQGISEVETNKLLELILSQTERIGGLLARFRPIVSSKSKEEWFNVFDQVTKVFTNLNARLVESNISYAISGNRWIMIWGDAIQFEQVFYNLILNSMQAISQTVNNGSIRVVISSSAKKVNILFSDNGPGIPADIARQIYEPFFSTKDPSSENGGEGLGLFIVWNVLKMFNGSIELDKAHINGAKFNIQILLQDKEIVTNE